MNYNWDADKKVSQFLKNLDIYTYLNLYYVINTMKTWLAKEDLKKTGKKNLKTIFLDFCFRLFFMDYLFRFFLSIKSEY